MRDADIGGLSHRGFAVATISLTLLVVGAYLALPFGKGSPAGQPTETAVAQEIGVLRCRLDEVAKAQLAIAQRLEALEKTPLQGQPPPSPTGQTRSKHRP